RDNHRGNHHLAATPTRHPDCRALPIQIVALYKPTRRRCLRLKRMVKRRHNTISDSEIVTITDRKHQEKVQSKHR
ncbi:hypothetical protein ABIB75_008083, partial [Bradyrhizobium sp. GM2.2]|uniref:hypothetical protein n=1 Tax=Bradyrhizobium sp. GM2.2 TaxID=3156358 RepID=UPI00339A29F7